MFIVSLEPINEEIGSEVDIGPLLFEVFDFNGTGKAREGNDKGKPSLARPELTQVDGEVGNGLQGPDVDLLPGRRARVMWERLSSRCEIPDAVNFMRREKFSA